MPAKEYHSPSSLSLGARCKRAYAYRYIDGLKDPEIPWAEIEAGRMVTPGQRSKALGTAVHAIFEDYYRGKIPNWATLPGRIAEPALAYMPKPDDGALYVVEDDFRIVVGDITFGGRLDLVRVPTPDPSALTVADRYGVPTLIDHKTSSNIRRYAKTAAELVADTAANMYALHVARTLNVLNVPGLWNYVETGKVRRGLPVEFLIDAGAADKMVSDLVPLARELDALTTSADAPCNTAACTDFGGCEYHHSRGGPCEAREQVGPALVKQLVRSQRSVQEITGMSESRFARFRQPTPAAVVDMGEIGGSSPPAQVSSTEVVVGDNQTVAPKAPADALVEAIGRGEVVAGPSVALSFVDNGGPVLEPSEAPTRVDTPAAQAAAASTSKPRGGRKPADAPVQTLATPAGSLPPALAEITHAYAEVELAKAKLRSVLERMAGSL